MTDDLWVFAYGSLIWRPGFAYGERVRGRLDGYRRSFCMESIHYRGTEAAPGLVLALDPQPDACCEGMALRVPAAEAADVLAYLRERELISYAYVEEWLDLTLDDGRVVQAVAYVINKANRQYCGDLDRATQAKIIARAHGSAGPNADYLFTTVAHLEQIGCPDAEMIALAEEVRRIRGQEGAASDSAPQTGAN